MARKVGGRQGVQRKGGSTKGGVASGGEGRCQVRSEPGLGEARAAGPMWGRGAVQGGMKGGLLWLRILPWARRARSLARSEAATSSPPAASAPAWELLDFGWGQGTPPKGAVFAPGCAGGGGARVSQVVKGGCVGSAAPRGGGREEAEVPPPRCLTAVTGQGAMSFLERGCALWRGVGG